MKFDNFIHIDINDSMMAFIRLPIYRSCKITYKIKFFVSHSIEYIQNKNIDLNWCEDDVDVDHNDNLNRFNATIKTLIFPPLYLTSDE